MSGQAATRTTATTKKVILLLGHTGTRTYNYQDAEKELRNMPLSPVLEDRDEGLELLKSRYGDQCIPSKRSELLAKVFGRKRRNSTKAVRSSAGLSVEERGSHEGPQPKNLWAPPPKDDSANNDLPKEVPLKSALGKRRAARHEEDTRGSERRVTFEAAALRKTPKPLGQVTYLRVKLWDMVPESTCENSWASLGYWRCFWRFHEFPEGRYTPAEEDVHCN